MDKITKYKEKARVLLIIYPENKKDEIKNIKELYDKNKKDFHKRWLKLIFDVKEKGQIEIILVGFDGTVKKRYKRMDVDKIIKDIDKMENKEYVKSLNKINFSLYEEYKPKSKISGLGFKDKGKAEETLKKIKNMPLSYQKRTIITMKARAENHPHQTEGMRDAIGVFNTWLKKF